MPAQEAIDTRSRARGATWKVLSDGSCWSPRGGSRRCCWSSCAGSSSSACWPTGRTWPTRRCRERVVDPQGRVLYTGSDISKGQQVFLHNGLMEYGSAFGHGAYLGPDYTADYLRRASDLVHALLRRHRPRTRRRAGRSRTSAPTATTSAPGRCALTAPQALAFRRLVPYYSRVLLRPEDRPRAATQRDHRPARSCAS